MLTFWIYVVHLGIDSGCLSLGTLNPVTRVYLPRLSTLWRRPRGSVMEGRGLWSREGRGPRPSRAPFQSSLSTMAATGHVGLFSTWSVASVTEFLIVFNFN